MGKIVDFGGIGGTAEICCFVETVAGVAVVVNIVNEIDFEAVKIGIVVGIAVDVEDVGDVVPVVGVVACIDPIEVACNFDVVAPFDMEVVKQEVAVVELAAVAVVALGVEAEVEVVPEAVVPGCRAEVVCCWG